MYKLNINQKWMSLVIVGLSLIGVMTALFSNIYRPTMAVATVNVTGMVSSFVKETSLQNLTMDQKQKKVNQFGQIMQRVMDDIAKRQHVVIILSEAVIAGSTDLTQEVMVAIKKEMK